MVASKLAIAGLIGASGAVMILGAVYIGDELSRQLMSRDALAVQITESVPAKAASIALSAAHEEEKEWAQLATESLSLYQIPGLARSARTGPLSVFAVSNIESMGYPNGVILVSKHLPTGLMVPVTLNDFKVTAIVMPPNSPRLEELIEEREVVLTGVRRLYPLLSKGFIRQVYLQASSVEAIEKMEAVAELMASVEGRRVYLRSALPLLIKIREIRTMQRYILWVVTIGAALAMGLICGALAWMEFREERYLLSLICSFGVGRKMLLGHAVLENCMVAVSGMAAGLGVLALFAMGLQDGVMELSWLDPTRLIGFDVFGVLLLGALLGGVLSCVPVAIGLRRPLGLTLK